MIFFSKFLGRIVLEKLSKFWKNKQITATMGNDFSGISDEVSLSSLSKCMHGEIHYSDKCTVGKINGKLKKLGHVVVFIRICHCGKHENKFNILSNEKQRIAVPQDGVDVHQINENCKYISEKNFDSSLQRHVYRFRLTCHCAARHGAKRLLDYN